MQCHYQLSFQRIIKTVLIQRKDKAKDKEKELEVMIILIINGRLRSYKKLMAFS